MLSDAQFVKILVSEPLTKFLQLRKLKLLTFQRHLKLFQFGAGVHREEKRHISDTKLLPC